MKTRRRTLRKRNTRGTVGGQGYNNAKQVRFSNNTKRVSTTNTINTINTLPSSYLENIYDATIRLPASPLHETNAHFLAKVIASHGSVEKMLKDIWYIYYPKDMTSRDYSVLIDLVDGSTALSENRKSHILNNLRYQRAVTKIHRQFYSKNENAEAH